MGKNIEFNRVQVKRPTKSHFDLSHDVKLSCNMGQLVPILCQPTIPGDKWKISAEAMVRFQPLIAPVMHRMDVTMHYFFVPNRILWDGWEDFITNTKTAGVLPAFPTFTIGSAQYDLLADYLGIPNPISTETETVSALPFAAYQKVWYEYYRDQNMQDFDETGLGDGDQTGSFLTYFGILRYRAWEHDYFTSALPFAQKGEAVALPLGEVSLKDTWMSDSPPYPYFQDLSGNPAAGTNEPVLTDDAPVPGIEGASDVGNYFAYDPQGSLEIEPTTINDLRTAMIVQEWLEKNARGGTRYIEHLKSHFNVNSSDKRLQRPEYITGTKSPVTISEVLNTTGTEDAPQGNMAGHAISITSGKRGSYYCEEHGYIIGIMSIMPKTAYQQGLERHWFNFGGPTDFPWPSFAHLGEQAILKKEIYAYQNIAGNDTFGYIPRYSEYKYIPSRVAGDFRTSLNFWHLSRIFATPPQLNDEFIISNPTKRVFAVVDSESQQLLCHVFNKIQTVRPLPKFSTPKL